MSLGKKPHDMVRHIGIVENSTSYRHRLFIDAQHQNSFPQRTPAEFADDVEKFLYKKPEKEKQDKRRREKDRQERNRHVDDTLPGHKIIPKTSESHHHRRAEGRQKKLE